MQERGVENPTTATSYEGERSFLVSDVTEVTGAIIWPIISTMRHFVAPKEGMLSKVRGVDAIRKTK